ncbi:hypothetical protein [Thiothrix fructosivorans]|jgi:hypothetical protein|uniref:Uncharacterized protein n=1 Tax=Thiothrix fructosivorans TaxID=111770 RepID=A0A8B0SG90_9GAMM|nr:hypothetical protein [Thiothrix fructosivorans]MBO0615049.1 hypothetical protein [Thiothrix fructosivorans]QTX09845.1 hypothetical protein J1836_014705 [Thiothrix fructosivorans]
MSMGYGRTKAQNWLSCIYTANYCTPAVLEKMTQSCFANAKRKLDNPRQLTDWRLWRTVADDLKACFPVDARFGDDNIKSLSERPRKRMLQCLPSPLLVLLNQCREMELSRV